ESGRLLHSPIGHPWFIRTLRFFPDGKRLVPNTSFREEMIVWDVATSRPFAFLQTDPLQKWISVTVEGKTIRFLNWRVAFPTSSTPAPDGRSIAVSKDRLSIREVASGKDRLQIPLTHQADDLTFSPNGRFLACTSHGSEGDIRVFSTATGKL